MAITLKEANLEDWQQEYDICQQIPAEENGYQNKCFAMTPEEFRESALPRMINNAKGIDLPEGYVPATKYFIWDDDKIVGMISLRHMLNDKLRRGAGHIGYAIAPKYRGKGYATKALELLIEKAKDIVKEDFLLFSVYKNNPASLRVQQKNGAQIVGEYIGENDGIEHYQTKIKLR